MANPKGNPQKLVKIGNEPVAETAISVKLPLTMDAWVRARPNRADWLRKAIADAYERDLANEANS